MTYEEFMDIVEKVGNYILWGFATIGFITVVAFFGYSSYEPPKKVVRASLCNNSSCENCPVKPTRFKRHQGVCE